MNPWPCEIQTRGQTNAVAPSERKVVRRRNVCVLNMLSSEFPWSNITQISPRLSEVFSSVNCITSRARLVRHDKPRLTV